VRTQWAVVLGLLVLPPAYGAPQGGTDVSVDYHGTGTVLALLPPPSSLHATRPVIVIQHDPIPGLMDDAMSMPFLAASVALFRELRAGDRIAFGLRVEPDALLVVHIKRLGPQP
jgi:Copper binding periplasmic protein CusF